MTSQDTSRFPQSESTIPYDIAKHRLTGQLAQLDALDAKIAGTLGFASALVAIFAGFLALNGDHLPKGSIAAFSIAVAIYVFLTIVLLKAYFVRDWEGGPKLDEVWTNAGLYEPRILGWWATESFTSCYVNNRAGIVDKARAAKLGAVLVVAQTIALVTGLAIVAFA